MRRLLAAVLVSLLIPSAGASAQTAPESRPPVLLSADRLAHDQETDVVTAEGNVEIAQGGRILRADRVSYDRRADVVTAEGHVAILEPDGEVIFADRVQLEDEMKNGVVKNIRILMADRTRMAANGARRTGGNRTEMRKAVFSPCRPCADHPERTPLWQIKAFRVVHDQQSHTIEYTDAFLEVFGVPVLYTPYFAHPDPTVKRKSGFLAPAYGTSTALGLKVETPYFWNIDDSRDFTFEPLFTSKEGVVLAGEYRQNTGNGVFRLGGSFTHVNKRDDQGERSGGEENRGHVEGQGRFALGPNWLWGFDLLRASDDTFLSRYGFNFADTLVTDLNLQGQQGRRWFSATAYAFQDLLVDDDPGQVPLVLPTAEYQFFSDPNARGMSWSAEASLLTLTRADGADSRRISAKGGWHWNFTGASGDVYSVSTTLRGDLYWVNGVANPADPNASSLNGVTGRVIPEVTLGWRFPLIASHGTLRQVIEPVITAIVSPNGGNPDRIPNEDSKDFEFDATNLFSSNRFSGLDRIEGGARVNYGLRWGLFGEGGGRVALLVGESFRLKDDSTFGGGTGLDRNFSDYVGQIQVSPGSYFDVNYRFRLDRENFSARRNEVNAQIGPSYLNASVSFLQLDPEGIESGESEFAAREEISSAATMALTNHWRLNLSHRRDLTGGGGTLNMGGALVYEDECTFFSVRADRNFTSDRDVAPDTTVLFTIRFKHLG